MKFEEILLEPIDANHSRCPFGGAALLRSTLIVYGKDLPGERVTVVQFSPVWQYSDTESYQEFIRRDLRRTFMKELEKHIFHEKNKEQ